MLRINLGVPPDPRGLGPGGPKNAVYENVTHDNQRLESAYRRLQLCRADVVCYIAQ